MTASRQPAAAGAAASADPAPTGSADPADPLAQLGLSFKAVTGAMRRLRGRETQRVDELSYAQYSLLVGLADGTPRSSRDLAFAADLAPATVTQMLDNLAAHGLVGRVRSSTDKRVVLTSLTERAGALVEERRAEFEKLWRAALAEFSASELATAAAVLDRLALMFSHAAEE